MQAVSECDLSSCFSGEMATFTDVVSLLVVAAGSKQASGEAETTQPEIRRKLRSLSSSAADFAGLAARS